MLQKVPKSAYESDRKKSFDFEPESPLYWQVAGQYVDYVIKKKEYNIGVMEPLFASYYSGLQDDVKRILE